MVSSLRVCFDYKIPMCYCSEVRVNSWKKGALVFAIFSYICEMVTTLKPLLPFFTRNEVFEGVGGKDLISLFSFVFTCVIDLSFLLSKIVNDHLIFVGSDFIEYMNRQWKVGLDKLHRQLNTELNRDLLTHFRVCFIF